MSKLKKIPVFNSEDEEKVILPKLKPSTKTISLRLPEHILDELKMMARKRDVPYQSLIKIFLKDRLNQELRHSG
jgi:predicted DNA binding CopG/RHH family protein